MEGRLDLSAGPWSSLKSFVLTEGRIEPSDGTLMCSYHGWRFRSDGACTKIPQALDAKAEQAACSSGRSCAAVYPTQVHIHKSISIWVASLRTKKNGMIPLPTQRRLPCSTVSSRSSLLRSPVRISYHAKLSKCGILWLLRASLQLSTSGACGEDFLFVQDELHTHSHRGPVCLHINVAHNKMTVHLVAEASLPTSCAGAAGLPARVGERQHRLGRGSCAAAADTHPAARPQCRGGDNARRHAYPGHGEAIYARPALQLGLPRGEPHRSCACQLRP